MRSISLSEATPYLAHRVEDNSRRTRPRTFVPRRRGVLGCFGARGNATHSFDLEMRGGLRSVPNIIETACILRRQRGVDLATASRAWGEPIARRDQSGAGLGSDTARPTLLTVRCRPYVA